DGVRDRGVACLHGASIGAVAAGQAGQPRGAARPSRSKPARARAMSDPVSWLLIETGWSVVDREGEEVGKVEETVGDSSRDSVNGITIGTGLLKRGRYVPAEQVAEINEGSVRLTISTS